jgi:hypothetical protein
MSTIASMHCDHMSEQEYDRERANIRNADASSAEAAAKREQALASLFYRSGWAQEQLQKKEVKTHQWVSHLVQFGRFLNFANSFIEPESLPKNLGAKKFLAIWEQQAVQKERNERRRFQTVLKLLRSESITMARRPSIGKSIKERFADGNWHQSSVIAEQIDADERHVLDTIHGMSKNGNFGCKVERKKVGSQIHYRIFKQDKAVSVEELTTKLRPIVEGLKAEGKKNMATMVPAEVAMLAARLERLLNEWAE